MGKGFWVALVAIVAVMVGAVVVLSDRDNTTTNQVDNPHEITDSDFTQGPDDAPLTLVKYSDFQCPSCAASAAVLAEVKPEYEGELRFVYRFFPLTQIFAQAYDASRAAVAAGAQGAFWDMHDVLFARQQDWSGNPQARSLFEDYAEELGLDLEQYRQDVTDASSRVDRDSGIGNQLGVSGTPTFFLNGERVEQTPQTVETWRELLDAALAARADNADTETE